MAEIARPLLSIAGSAVGFAIGGPAGAYAGSMLGGVAGSYLFPMDTQYEGPRLQDLRVQQGTYGKPISWVFNTYRLAGSIIEAFPLREVRTEQEVSAKGTGDTQTRINYEYFATGAVAICKGPLVSVKRVWSDGKVSYDREDVTTILGNREAAEEGIPLGPYMRLYLGTDIQQPSPVLESIYGVGNVPAYRGTAYVVFDNLPVGEYGNRIPNFEFEVFKGPTYQEGFYTEHTDSLNEDDNPFIAQAIDRDNKRYFIAVNEGSILAGSFAGSRTTSIDMMRADISVEIGGKTCTPYYLSLTLAADGASPMLLLKTEEFESRYAGIVVLDPATLEISQVIEAPGLSVLGLPTPGSNVSFRQTSSNEYLICRSDAFNLGLRAVKVLDGEVVYFESPIFSESNDYLTLIQNRAQNESFLIGTDKIMKYSSNQLTLVVDSDASYFARTGLERNLFRSIELFPDEYQDDKTMFYIWGSTASPLPGDEPTRLIGINTEHTSVSNQPAYTLFTITKEALYAKLNAEVPIPTIGNASSVGIWGTDFYMRKGDSVFVCPISPSDLNNIQFELFPLPSSTTSAKEWGPIASRGLVITPEAQIGFGFPDETLTYNVADVVREITGYVGISPGRIDATNLEQFDFQGYVISSRTSARNPISQLTDAFGVNAVDSGTLLKFTAKKDAPYYGSIPQEDMGSEFSGNGEQPAIKASRGQSIELPREVEMIYSDPQLEYRENMVRARRFHSDTEKIDNIQLPMVLPRERALALAEAKLASAWVSRDKYEFQVQMKYADLEAGDIVDLETDTGPVRAIVDEAAISPNGLIRIKASVYDRGVHGGIPETPAFGDFKGQTLLKFGDVILAFIDTAMLTEQDDTPGFYAAAFTPSKQAKFGAPSLFRSVDGGDTYSYLTNFTQEATVGQLIGTLPTADDNENTWIYDYDLQVRMLKGNLYSADSKLSVLNGANAIIVGQEIIQFLYANQDPVSGIYTLRGLLRGRKGTEWASNSHEEGELVVAFGPGLIRVEQSLELMGVELLYKLIPNNGTLLSTTAVPFTNLNNRLECLSPVSLAAEDNLDGSYTLTWKRRTRIGGQLRDRADVPLGESSEAYEVRLYNDSNVLTRTLSATTQTITVTPAVDEVKFSVTQLSSKVGTGFESLKFTFIE